MPTLFPGAIDTNLSLLTAVDNVQTVLTSDIAIDSSSIYVVDTSNFPDEGILTIHNKIFSYYEKLYYTSKTPTSFGGLSRPNPITISPCTDVYVSALITEDYHNYLRNAIIEIEKYLVDDSTSDEADIKIVESYATYVDITRTKRISTSRYFHNYSRNRRSLESQYLRYLDGMASSSVGPRFMKDAVITGISIQCANNVDADFIIRKNKSLIDLISISVSASDGTEQDNLNLDVSKGDMLQLYMSVNSGTVNRPIINIEYAWRF